MEKQLIDFLHLLRRYATKEKIVALSDDDFKLPKLHAHGYVDYVLIVPNESIETTQIWLTIIRSPLVRVWTVVVVIFTIARKLLQSFAPAPIATMSDILFDTIGLAFGTASGGAHRIRYRPERILVLSLSIVAMLAAIISPSQFFEEFSTFGYRPKINTLDELQKSGMRIMMPNRMGAENIKWWNKT